MGNKHYNTIIIGYVKYCPTNNNTIWCSKHTCYERIVKIYDPRIIYESTHTRMYIPYYGGVIPVIPIGIIRKIYNPLNRRF